MDWIRVIAASILSALLTGAVAFFKNSHDTDVKLAVLESRLALAELSLSEFKRATNESISEIASDMKTAARELITAASAIQVTAQSQNVVNQVATKTMDSLVAKVEVHGGAIAELRGIIHSLNNKSNHRP